MTSFCEIILASPSPGERDIFNRTLIKAVHLPHESVGGDAPPFFPPLVYHIRDSWRWEGLPRQMSRVRLTSRWRIVGIDELRSHAAAAGLSRSRHRRRRRHRYRHPPTFTLPLRARVAILRKLPSISPSLSPFRLRAPAPCRLSWPQHRLEPPRTASTASKF